MSAMSELDLMLKEYEGARAAMVSAAGTTILGHMQAAENVIRAADVLACSLRAMLVPNARSMPANAGDQEEESKESLNYGGLDRSCDAYYGMGQSWWQ